MPGKLFVGGLSHVTTDKSLREYFQQFGEIAQSEVLRDHQTLNSRGFGFITFADKRTANEVLGLGQLSPHQIDGKNVEVKVAVAREVQPRNPSFSPTTENLRSLSFDFEPRKRFLERAHTASSSGSSEAYDCDYRMSPPTSRRSSYKSSSSRSQGSMMNKLFIGGLLYSSGHESLRRFFEKFGEVVSAEVIYNRETKRSRGFGFVVMGEFDHVARILWQQKLCPLMIDGKQIEVKRCKAREECLNEQISQSNYVYYSRKSSTNSIAEDLIQDLNSSSMDLDFGFLDLNLNLGLMGLKGDVNNDGAATTFCW